MIAATDGVNQALFKYMDHDSRFRSIQSETTKV